jgi:hypothetical protein
MNCVVGSRDERAERDAGNLGHRDRVGAGDGLQVGDGLVDVQLVAKL